METDKNYFLVGLFVLIVILASLGFTLWLTSVGKGPMADYRIRFTESVGGLKLGSAVKFQGVDVGNVKKMAIDPQDIHVIQVDVRILAAAPVKADTVASLKLLGISGDMYVELTGGSLDAPDLVAAAKNGELPEIHAEQNGITSVMDRLPQIVDKTDHLLEKANHIAAQIDKVFSDQNIKAINSVMKKLEDHYGDNDDKGSSKSP